MKRRDNPWRRAVVVTVLFFSVWKVFAAVDVASIDVSVTGGAVGSRFSVYGGHGSVAVNGNTIDLTFKSRFTKLVSRDDSSDGPKRVTPDNPWRTNVRFSGPGIF